MISLCISKSLVYLPLKINFSLKICHCQLEIPSSVEIICTAFSPTSNAVLYVFAPTIDGKIDKSEYISSSGSKESTSHFQSLSSVYVQMFIDYTILFFWLHRGSSPITIRQNGREVYEECQLVSTFSRTHFSIALSSSSEYSISEMSGS